MTIALRRTRCDDSYVSTRVFDGVRHRDSDASARDRDRARKLLADLRANAEKRD